MARSGVLDYVTSELQLDESMANPEQETPNYDARPDWMPVREYEIYARHAVLTGVPVRQVWQQVRLAHSLGYPVFIEFDDDDPNLDENL